MRNNASSNTTISLFFTLILYPLADLKMIMHNKQRTAILDPLIGILVNGTLYITLDQNELKKGKLVATNIEVMGC